MSKIHWFPRVVFPCAIGFCPDEKSWNKFCKSKGIKEPYPTESGRCTLVAKGGECYILIVVNNVRDYRPAEIIGVLAHECSHAFDFMCEQYGEDTPSAEFKAYSIQNFVMQAVVAYDDMREQILKESE